MQEDLSNLRLEVLIRLTKLEAKAELLESNDSNLKEDIEEIKTVFNDNLVKLDEKLTYIERDMPSASTYKFIIVVVGIVLTAATGIILSAIR